MTSRMNSQPKPTAGSASEDASASPSHLNEVTRRRFLQAAAVALSGFGLLPDALAGPSSRLTIPLLKVQGAKWDIRPNGLRKMIQEVEKRTSIAVDAQQAEVSPGNKRALFEYPLIFWSGEGGFPPLSQGEVDNLSLYLQAGGLLVVDSAEATRSGPFEDAVRRELRRIVPEGKVVDVPKSHVLYKSFYLIPEPVGRVAASSRLQGIFGEDRAMVLLSVNDMLGAWSRDNLGNYEFDVFPGGDRQREMSYRLGINIVMYSMCLNYKEDQVHVPFILKRRKWKVD